MEGYKFGVFLGKLLTFHQILTHPTFLHKRSCVSEICHVHVKTNYWTKMSILKYFSKKDTQVKHNFQYKFQFRTVKLDESAEIDKLLLQVAESLTRVSTTSPDLSTGNAISTQTYHSAELTSVTDGGSGNGTKARSLASSCLPPNPHKEFGN